jgi:hypothetical protein
MSQKRTMEEHGELYRQAGWDFRGVLAAHPDHPPCAWSVANGLLQQVGLALLEDGSYHPPEPQIPRACEACAKHCVSECPCGEAYCSKDCQAKEWKSHRHIHETVVDNNEMAVMITAQYWGPEAELQ